MSQKSGMQGKLVLVPETTWNTTPSPAAGYVIPFESETMKYTCTREKDPTITGGRDYKRPAKGPVNVAGDVRVRIDPNAHSWLFRELLGAPATEVSGSAYKHTFKSNGATPPPVGCHLEREIDGEWFLYTGNRASKATFEIGGTGLFAGTFSFIGADETQSSTPVDDTVATETFTGTGLDDLTSGGTYTGSGESNFRVQIDATGTPDTFKWSNDGGTTWEATGVNITGSAQSLENGATAAFAATTGHTVGDYWDFQAGPTEYQHLAFDLGSPNIVIKEGGVATAELVNITFDVDNETQASEPSIGGEGVASGVTHGKCAVTGTVRAIYQDNDLYTKARQSTESSLEFSVQHGTGDGTAGNEKITIKIPELLYNAAATTIDTPRGLYVEQGFEAYFDNSAEGTAFQITLENTIASLA